MARKTTGSGIAAQALNSSQHLVNTGRGNYLIQVSWPLDWKHETTDGSNLDDVPIIYLVDGNAYFFTATDVVRRLQFAWGKKAIIVGVGYPLTNAVFSDRRSLDLTPPSKQEIRHPITRDTNTRYGEADGFLSALVDEIMPFVETQMLPTGPLRNLNRVLFGHSFGGLFSLYTLFARPDLFATYIAASPSIWWNDCSIIHEQEHAFLNSDKTVLGVQSDGNRKTGKPNLYLTYGLREQYPLKRSSETDEQYGERKRRAASFRMKDNAVEMKDRLDASGRFDELWIQEFAGEDHGSAAVAGLQRGIMRILEEY